MDGGTPQDSTQSPSVTEPNMEGVSTSGGIDLGQDVLGSLTTEQDLLALSTEALISSVSVDSGQLQTDPMTQLSAEQVSSILGEQTQTVADLPDASSLDATVVNQQADLVQVTQQGTVQQPLLVQSASAQPVVAQSIGQLTVSQALQTVSAVGMGGNTVMLAPASSMTMTAQSTQQPVRTVQAVLKRPASSTGPPVITKVIITKTASGHAIATTTVVTTATTQQQVVTQATLQSPTKVLPASPIIMAPGTPVKAQPPPNKVPISPLKTPTKVTVVPVSITSPPKRIAPAPVVATTGAVSSGGPVVVTLSKVLPGTTTHIMSPTKLAIRPATMVTTAKPVGTPVQMQQPVQSIRLATPPNVQQIHVPGSKFQYVRLVTTTTAAPSLTSNPSVMSKPNMVTAGQVNRTVTIAPATTSTVAVQPKQVIQTIQMKPANIPIAPAPIQSKPLTGQVPVSVAMPQQRIIMPATSFQQIRPNQLTSVPNISQLPPGTFLVSNQGANQQGGGVQTAYAVVPAQYVQQVSQQPSTTTSYVPITTNNFQATTAAQPRQQVNGTLNTEQVGTRPRKPCNCTKSQCLKLYCDCFANGEFCNNCNCNNCFNNLEHEAERAKSIKACLERNPYAFHPKIGKGKEGEGDRRHNKGCNCKRSGCLKNYCECYEAKIMCSSICKCVGCKNFEESPERKTLMHLADAAEVRVQQQTAAKTKLSSQIQDIPARPPAVNTAGERLPFSFVTRDVAEATCSCLLAQAEEAEKANCSPAMMERMVLEEFGRCLLQIIHSAGKTRGQSPNNQ
ncbi:protein lin-54 homolog isoform X1 [Branchiostoma lanceolatum]|uniref:protein lin-54 homolog isoform X1 n=1 Tax=Branchiostoma lanceolatum TaxID=7740 RepID=UPI0034570E09